ncbi:MAG TPA: KEOPS complex subunit Pcc1 [Methanobacteriaceae archaeon]|jgi:tRNA threonylcarbamoyladenosine modification (KEOPS) complex  Pcc1 subunit|nr:KEOPS complex subunit Pcc1 [Methanobacteriaceae archaeon]
MLVKAQIVIEYQNKEQAEISLKSLDPENENYVESESKGPKVKFKISGDSLRTFLATADSLIFDEMTVEKILENSEGSRLI